MSRCGPIGNSKDRYGAVAPEVDIIDLGSREDNLRSVPLCFLGAG